MSYGVVATKSGQVQVETIVSPGERSYDRARERFRAPVAGPWAAGRLTLTGLHLAFMPTRSGRGVRSMTINLADITSVEASPGRLSKTVSFRTETMVVHARVNGAMAFAKRVAISVEATRRRGAANAAREQSAGRAPSTP
ncbi:MAG: hypothetical protein OSB43_15545 [Nocardioides sp.]|uniref:hypothetical protein n=1 Tax=Nocardioides sp. TaxID=35761 RepID=UPI000C899F83|nr:hypothetical protein [Nocardioides sp.]MAS55085.1 hypothetical protein [Pimelobacter sp.]MDE0777690.1 hypothetical protein [Nocardioides sp.]